jgi:hypothetical protein
MKNYPFGIEDKSIIKCEMWYNSLFYL